ncbi:MAG: elongation factor G [Ardenticatenales bacterium]|nr:elongation factor G [Ardenticatenales bacterium]
MKEYSADKIRNIALVGHSGAGKTQLTEAFLYLTKVTTRMGRPEEGNTVSDFDAEEHRRGISISSSVIPVEYEGHKLNFLDTPGYADLVGNVKSALTAAETALLVVDAVAGVEVGTELAWQMADELGLAKAVVLNKMDRDNANWKTVLGQLRESFPDARFVPLQVPIGQSATFNGVYRLISKTASMGAEGKAGDAPPDVLAEADDLREQLVEAAAEGDDALIMKFLDGEALTPDEIRHGLQEGAKAGKYVPVYFAAADSGIGIHALLHQIITAAPSPVDARPVAAERAGKPVELVADGSGPLAVRVFKTMADPYVGKLQYLRVVSGTLTADSKLWNANQGEEERIGPLYVVRGKEQMTVGRLVAGDVGAVAKLHHTHTFDTLTDKDGAVTLRAISLPQPLYAVALHPESQADGGKIGPSLQRLVEEDPTYRTEVNAHTHELTLSGMGEAHIDVAVRQLKDKFGVKVTTTVPKVPYMETITRTASAQYRHKKQTGGAGQFAEVHLRVEPAEQGAGFSYASQIVGGSISHSFIPSIEKGIRQVLPLGVIAACPVVDVKAIVFDGKEHPVDSKDIAFQIAGREAFKAAVRDAGPVLLEPVFDVSVIVPSAQMGDILSDMNTRRGMVQGTEQIGNKAVVNAQVPLAEIQRYATDLRSMTQGRGYFTAAFAHYARMPHGAAELVIAERSKDLVHHDD